MSLRREEDFFNFSLFTPKLPSLRVRGSCLFAKVTRLFAKVSRSFANFSIYFAKVTLLFAKNRRFFPTKMISIGFRTKYINLNGKCGPIVHEERKRWSEPSTIQNANKQDSNKTLDDTFLISYNNVQCVF